MFGKKKIIYYKSRDLLTFKSYICKKKKLKQSGIYHFIIIFSFLETAYWILIQSSMMFFVYQLHCMSPCSLIYLIITLWPPLGISEFAIWRYKMSPVWTWMESSQVSAQHCSRQLITWSCFWNAELKVALLQGIGRPFCTMTVYHMHV